MRATLLGVIVLLLAVATPAAAQEPDGEALYQANCSQCHQAGGVGVPGLFPPLAGNDHVEDAEYVRGVIRNGREGEIEVLGQTYNQAMPAIAGLSDAEVDAIVQYLQVDLQAAAEPTDTTVAAGPDEPIVGAALLEASARGEELFVGRVRLENGGPACIACHSAGDLGGLSGPLLGPNLAGAAVAAQPHPGDMAALYADDPLSDTERADLAAFLEVEGGGDGATFVDGLVVMGLGGLLLLVGFAVAIGFRREGS